MVSHSNYQISPNVEKLQIFIKICRDLVATDADHVGVVPASRVGEDDDQHEHPGEDLEDPAELEEAGGGGETDGEPDEDGADRDDHREAGEDGGGPEGGGDDGGEVRESSTAHVKPVPAVRTRT